MTRKLSPRCGRVMLKYEAALGPLIDDVVCGLREGHGGRCRSEQSLANRRAYQREHWPKRRELRNSRRRELTRLARQLRDHAVPADPPSFDAEDQHAHGHPVAAGHDTGLPRLPRADVLDSAHVRHYNHGLRKLTCQ